MLDKNNLKELKNKLLQEKKQLEEDLSKIADKESDEEYETKFQEIGRDEEANADEVEAYTANLGITETLEKDLKAVNDALERIENSTYGKCEACSEDIPLERLRAYSAAKTCIKCKGENKK
jgi:RNA polymerase-binding protein DksA